MNAARPERPSGWVLGHVAGAPVVLAPSWLLAAVVLTVLFAPNVSAWTGQTGTLSEPGGVFLTADANQSL